MAIRAPKNRKPIQVSVGANELPAVNAMVADLAAAWGLTRDGGRPNRSAVLLRCLRRTHAILCGDGWNEPTGRADGDAGVAPE